MEIMQHYDIGRLVLTAVVAVIASFTALNLVERGRSSRGVASAGWLLFAAIVLGGGVWTAHFLAMLAHSLDGVTVSYERDLTIWSAVVAMALCYLALGMVRYLGRTPVVVVIGGVFMGFGVATMHYLGMAAMRMEAEIAYDPVLYVASYLIGIVSSMAALWLAFHLETIRGRLVSAVAIAGAVLGMHFTGMWAASFSELAICLAAPDSVFDQNLLTVLVAAGAFFLCGLGLASSLLDKHVTRNLEQGDARVRQSEERLRLMINSVKDYSIIMLDTAGRVISWNDGASRIKGYSAEEAIGMSIAMFDADRRNAQANSARALSEAANRGRHEAEVRRRRRDGTCFWAHIVIHPLYDDSGRLSGFAKITRDISERRKAEEALRIAYDGLEAKVEERTRELIQAKEAAETANAAKSSFLANMSHELRTPLNAIIGYTEMLIEDFQDAGNDETVDDLQRIEKSGRHLLNLINEVLDLAKVEAGGITLEFEPVQPGAVLEEAIGTVTPLAHRNGNRIHMEIGDIPAFVEADRKRMFQCVLNLLSNAAKFTTEGEICVSVDRTPTGSRDGIVIRIRDTGIGMTPEQLERVFDPFAQADDRITREYEGTGLGLTITRRFCRMMGGDIVASSVFGEGSEFVMTLPTRQDGTAAEDRSGEDDTAGALLAESDQAAFGDGQAEAEPASTDGSPLALVIDDDPDALDLGGRVLQRAGYRVRQARDGEEGLALIRGHHPDLVILDISMPELDGWGVLQAVRRDPQIADIPVVVTSVQDDSDRGRRLGVVDWLVKPVSAESLGAVTRRLRLGMSRPRALVLTDRVDVTAALSDGMDDRGIDCLFLDSPRSLTDLRQFGADTVFVDTRSAFGRPDILRDLRAQPGWGGFRIVVIGDEDPVDIPEASVALATNRLQDDLPDLLAQLFADRNGKEAAA